MKHVAMLMSVVMLVTGCSVMRLTVHTAGEVIKGATPKVDSPLLRQLGISIEGANMVVSNATPLYGRLFAYSTEVARLGPGDVAYDDRHLETHQPTVPLLMIFYRDENYADYVGAQTGSVSPQLGRSSEFVFLPNYILQPDGNYLNADAYPMPVSSLESKKTKLPRAWLDGTASAQFLNNTFHRALVRINGKNIDWIATGNPFFIDNENYSLVDGSGTVELVFVNMEAGKPIPVGRWSQLISFPAYGLPIYQFIVGPNEMQSMQRRY